MVGSGDLRAEADACVAAGPCDRSDKEEVGKIVAGIQTTVVGSYPVPDWLRVVPSEGGLRDAVMVVYKTQELAGIDVVSDGELSRFDVNHPETNGMIDYFVAPLEGVKTDFSRQEIEDFRRREGMAYRTKPAGVVTGPIGEGRLNLPADWELVNGLTRSRKKFTVTGPHMLSKVLIDAHYGDPALLAMALADVMKRQVEAIGADVVQIDEANISGHPDEWEWAAAAINRVLSGVRGERAVHVCFGNYGGQSVQRGTWEALLRFLNALAVDHLVLEFARRGYDELSVLRDLDSKIGIGLGVVDIKDNEVESAELIARRLEHAATVLGEDRVRYIHPDCGFWMLQRSVADRKMRALVEGRDLFEGRKARTA